MTTFFQCKLPYPQLCKVWNKNELGYYFAILVDDAKDGRFVDHNDGLWEYCEPITEANLKNPIELLERKGLYNRFTLLGTNRL